MEFIGEVKNGRLICVGLKDAIQSLEGIKVRVTLEKWKKRRSSKQNRYRFGVVTKTVMEHINEALGTAYSLEEIDAFIKIKALGLYKTIEGVRIPGELKYSSTEEFEKAMEKIRAWAMMEYGIPIMLPNEPEVL